MSETYERVTAYCKEGHRYLTEGGSPPASPPEEVIKKIERLEEGERGQLKHAVDETKSFVEEKIRSETQQDKLISLMFSMTAYIAFIKLFLLKKRKRCTKPCQKRERAS